MEINTLLLLTNSIIPKNLEPPYCHYELIMTGQKTEIKFDREPFKKFFSNDSNVICALIFGSSKDGVIKAGSDLDIAVLFHNPPKGEEKLEYYAKLCDVNKNIEQIDFVVLNEANEILAFEALKGEYLCKNDIERTAEFFSLICRMYEDTISNIEYQYTLRVKTI